MLCSCLRLPKWEGASAKKERTSMKNWIALLLALVMSLSLCACGVDDNGKQDDGSKDGKVTVAKLTQVVMTEKDSDGKDRTMKATLEYDEDQNVIATKTYLDDKLYYEVTYDKDNKPLVELTYGDTGEIIDRTENTYDEKGNCVERINTYKYDDTTVTVKRISTFDANGNELTEKVYENGELSYEYHYTYTADGKLAKEAYINKDGNEESSTEKTYDEQGNVLSVKVDGMLSGSYETYENTYENGKLVEVKIYDQWDLEGQQTGLVRYDAQGNIILRVGYENGEEWSRTEYTYENGKLVKEVDYDDGKENYTAVYTYNADGKITEVSYTYTNGKTSSRAYSYNQAGDLTGMKQHEDGQMKGEYALTYETVTVSAETAEKLRQIVRALDLG